MKYTKYIPIDTSLSQTDNLYKLLEEVGIKDEIKKDIESFSISPTLSTVDNVEYNTKLSLHIKPYSETHFKEKKSYAESLYIRQKVGFKLDSNYKINYDEVRFGQLSKDKVTDTLKIARLVNTLSVFSQDPNYQFSVEIDDEYSNVEIIPHPLSPCYNESKTYPLVINKIKDDMSIFKTYNIIHHLALLPWMKDYNKDKVIRYSRDKLNYRYNSLNVVGKEYFKDNKSNGYNEVTRMNIFLPRPGTRLRNFFYDNNINLSNEEMAHGISAMNARNVIDSFEPIDTNYNFTQLHSPIINDVIKVDNRDISNIESILNERSKSYYRDVTNKYSVSTDITTDDLFIKIEPIPVTYNRVNEILSNYKCRDKEVSDVVRLIPKYSNRNPIDLEFNITRGHWTNILYFTLKRLLKTGEMLGGNYLISNSNSTNKFAIIENENQENEVIKYNVIDQFGLSVYGNRNLSGSDDIKDSIPYYKVEGTTSTGFTSTINVDIADDFTSPLNYLTVIDRYNSKLDSKLLKSTLRFVEFHLKRKFGLGNIPYIECSRIGWVNDKEEIPYFSLGIIDKLIHDFGEYLIYDPVSLSTNNPYLEDINSQSLSRLSVQKIKDVFNNTFKFFKDVSHDTSIKSFRIQDVFQLDPLDKVHVLYHGEENMFYQSTAIIVERAYKDQVVPDVKLDKWGEKGIQKIYNTTGSLYNHAVEIDPLFKALTTNPEYKLDTNYLGKVFSANDLISGRHFVEWNDFPSYYLYATLPKEEFDKLVISDIRQDFRDYRSIIDPRRFIFSNVQGNFKDPYKHDLSYLVSYNNDDIEDLFNQYLGREEPPIRTTRVSFNRTTPAEYLLRNSNDNFVHRVIEPLLNSNGLSFYSQGEFMDIYIDSSNRDFILQHQGDKSILELVKQVITSSRYFQALEVSHLGIDYLYFLGFPFFLDYGRELVSDFDFEYFFKGHSVNRQGSVRTDKETNELINRLINAKENDVFSIPVNNDSLIFTGELNFRIHYT